MRSHVRTTLVVALAVGLLALFLHNVDLSRVGAEMIRARAEWLALSLATMPLNLAVRSLRWRFLLEPLGTPTFGGVFRATAVGFAANTVLPARAGEVIRPYFLARQSRSGERMTTTGAFATIILERLLDVVTVLLLLASYVFFFGRDLERANPALFAPVKWAAATAAAAAIGGLVVLFFVAGHPERIGRVLLRLEQVLPSAIARVIASVAETFAVGLAVIRRP